MKRLLACALMLLALCLLTGAAAEQAQDITSRCDITHNGKPMGKNPRIADHKYESMVYLNPGESLVFSSSDELISGVFVQYFDKEFPLRIDTLVDGDWQPAAQTGEYLSEWAPLPAPAASVRLVNAGGKKYALSEVTIYGMGEKPDRVHVWHRLEKADLMLLVGHPDDELLWFGGLLPTYAGQRGLKVQVVYASAPSPFRRL